ncbi:MAG: HAMP domain-containing protein [Pedobacter sp.]|nr:MAG: HAMP domain-containing protein [Pedobacter sp.]
MSLLIYVSFRKQLNDGFSDQLKAGAAVVSSKVNINPRIVPLPHGNESFTIVYSDNDRQDTLYADDKLRSLQLNDSDSTFSYGLFRGVVFTAYPDNSGTLKVLYALPADGIERRINLLLMLVFAGIVIGCLLAALLAYKISGRILKPVMQVIQKANNTDIRTANTGRIISGAEDTELLELSDSFNRMLERISEQSQRRSAFFASASHELRTPLSVMQTRLQVMLQDKDQAGEDRSFLSGQLAEVKRLTKMVNDFLLMTELQQGSVSVLKQEVNLTEMIPEIIAAYRQKTVEKAVKIEMVFAPQESDFLVNADAGKLRVMLSNLLDNAIKYSPDAGQVHLSCVSGADDCVLSFSNTIRQDIHPDMAAIAREFYHAKPLAGEGLGLGLWITYALAEMQEMVITATMEEQLFKVVLIMDRAT